MVDSKGDLEYYSKKILTNMEREDFREIKSFVGLVEVSCTIVEEAYTRLNKASTSLEKKEIAVEILDPLIQKMEDEEVLEKDLGEKIRQELAESDINTTIEDTIISWRDRSEDIMYRCIRFQKFLNLLFGKKKTKLRKVPHH